MPTNTEDKDEVPNREASAAAASTMACCKRAAASAAFSPSSWVSSAASGSVCSVQVGEVGVLGSSG